MECHASIGVEGHASTTGGYMGGVGCIFDSVGMLSLGVGGVSEISGRAGQASRVPPLDWAARSTCDIVAPVIEAYIISAPSRGASLLPPHRVSL